MKYKLLLFLFCSCYVFSQDNTTYLAVESKENPKTSSLFYQFDLNIPLRGNQNRMVNNTIETTNTNWFLPNGLGTKLGIGFQKKKWIGVSIHSGVDWFANQKLVAIPLYGNLRLSPKVGHDSRFVFQGGLGHGFAVGRGKMNGSYYKFSIGYENGENLNIFIESSNYRFTNEFSGGNISLGISLRTF